MHLTRPSIHCGIIEPNGGGRTTVRVAAMHTESLAHIHIDTSNLLFLKDMVCLIQEQKSY
jgi:hypothetical protein